jgi:hypothetical protein
LGEELHISSDSVSGTGLQFQGSVVHIGVLRI